MVEGLLIGGCCGISGVDARVVDQDVDAAAEEPCRLPGQCLRGGGAAVQVGLHEVGAAASGADAVDDLLAASGAAARDDDVRPLGGERLRDGRALSHSNPGKES